jgi:hypothetical protein
LVGVHSAAVTAEESAQRQNVIAKSSERKKVSIREPLKAQEAGRIDDEHLITYLRVIDPLMKPVEALAV